MNSDTAGLYALIGLFVFLLVRQLIKAMAAAVTCDDSDDDGRPEPGKVRLFCRVPLPIGSGMESGRAEFELDVPEGFAYRIADLEWMRDDEAARTP